MSAEVLRVMPEIALFITTCVVMLIGLSPSAAVRRGCMWFSGLGIIIAIGLSGAAPASAEGEPALFPSLMPFAKTLIGVVGLLVLPLLAGTVDRREEGEIAAGRAGFDPLRSNRAEFYAFYLFSLTGLMLCASADDLIWLFLALELTSLPTYVLVSISTRRPRSQEAGVKYFFLGALGAAIFLYGFALIYGAAGSTNLAEIAAAFAEQRAAGGLSPIAIAGLAVALIGVSFKIAAVPMHFYAADVYQGAAAGVSAMLAFVPKAAGFVAILLLCGTAGWGDGGVSHGPGAGLPEPIYWLLAVMAVLTMTVGNVLALLQGSVKRVLAYSSVAHSGYMLVGVIAGPGLADAVNGGPAPFWQNGLAATLFYLLCYGVMNAGAFAVLACLERPAPASRDDEDAEVGEIDSIDDLRGLHARRPHLAAAMLLCSLSLLGMPPLLGFFGKAGLFVAAATRGEIGLVVVMAINSAIAGYYYLRLAAAAYLEPRDAKRADDLHSVPFVQRSFGALASAGGVVALVAFAGPLIANSTLASRYTPPPAGHGAALPPEAEATAGIPAAEPRDEPAATGLGSRDGS